jgi:type I restriction enzyme S subunit
MSKKWPRVPLGEVLVLREMDTVVSSAHEYQFAGVYSFGRGVFRGQKRLGSEFSYPKLTRLREGDFVYPKLMAWEGAFGVVPPECAGCYVSPEFPIFEAKPGALMPSFLGYALAASGVWSSIAGSSIGTNVRRRRLHPREFLKTELPIPPLAEQQRIVAWIEELKEKVKQARQLRGRAVSAGEAMLRSVLLADEDLAPTPMHNLVRQRDPDVDVRPAEVYEFAGVYSFRRGVFKGQAKAGTEFAYPRLTRLRAGDFVYPKLMAWEGALGVVDGLVVSTEFPVFEVNQERVLPEVLDTYFRTPSVWPELAGASTGTNVRRRRLNPSDFLSYQMPLPSRRIQERLRFVRSKVNDLRRLQAQTAAELDAHMPAILDRAFRGEL